jgi:hypothetical protein
MDQSARREMADVARQIVLSAHTGIARARQLVRELSHESKSQHSERVLT